MFGGKYGLDRYNIIHPFKSECSDWMWIYFLCKSHHLKMRHDRSVIAGTSAPHKHQKFTLWLDHLVPHISEDAFENEREYMKSQLDTELECKEQLQTALDKVNVQFAEAQARWKDQAEDAETARRNGAQESQAALSELRAAKISLEGEVAHLGEQLTEARAATQKHRDERNHIGAYL